MKISRNLRKLERSIKDPAQPKPNLRESMFWERLSILWILSGDPRVKTILIREYYAVICLFPFHSLMSVRWGFLEAM